MATLTLQEAQARLPDLVHKLAKGEEIAIMEGTQVVARLIGERPPNRPARKAGSARGLLTIVSEDDEHLKDFEDYMG